MAAVAAFCSSPLVCSTWFSWVAIPPLSPREIWGQSAKSFGKAAPAYRKQTNKQHFQPHWTILNAPRVTLDTTESYSHIQHITNSWEPRLPSDTHWASALLRDSKSSRSWEGTMGWAHPFSLPTKAGQCHSMQLCPEGRSWLHKESWTSLPCVFVSGNLPFPRPVSGSTLTALSHAEQSQEDMYTWDDPKHLFPHLYCYFQNVYFWKHLNIFLFLLMICISEVTHEQKFWPFLTFDWSH